MLDLQRASAGSGKTFALAKYYIRYLISIKPEGETHRRLRTLAELEDGLGRILAVTFTNKATEEMQMRIVEKLDDLARYVPGMKKPDYLDDFVAEFGVSPSEISRICKEALLVLLNDYSNFKVNTIDSFFQLVLRTFAYESGYSDTYQVELESDYVSRVGIDAVLDDVDSDLKDRDTESVRFWVDLLIRSEESTKWNIFQKQEPQGHHTTSPYKSLIASFRRIDNETFRENRAEIERYLGNDGNDLQKIYRQLEKKYRGKLRDAYNQMIDKAISVLEITDTPDLTDVKGYPSYVLTRSKKVLDYKWDKSPSESAVIKPLDESYLNKPSMKPYVDSDPGLWRERLNRFLDMYESMEQWLDIFRDPMFRLWDAIRLTFPFLGILKAVQRRRMEYLTENNSVELGETSMILNKIIGPTDTPFVYERMGTYLNHFLIDEFQDTSLIQWKNLSPLLGESMSRGQDNLVIGDAKQSIYRFRNAEPKLISEIVPAEYAGNVNLLGNSPEENKNWRSDHNIVVWNNSFFRYVVDTLPEIVSEKRRGDVERLFGNLYSNVKQDIRYPDGGYVRVYLTKRKENRGESDIEGDPVDSFERDDEVLQIILDALRRGYKQKDICILFRYNHTGTDLIDYLNSYNSKVIKAGESEDIESESYRDKPLLNFVSEQSLLVCNAESVRRVITILESISQSTKPEINPDGESRRRYGAGNVKDLECNLMLYMQLHPDLSRAECMDRFLNEDPDVNIILDMLSKMQTMALPALVEATVVKFVPADIRQRDGVFLAAFQDFVLDYCEGHPSDLPSFLRFWDRKKHTLCISSPKDTDAITLMSIHKSKGLEFPVVIVAELESVKSRLGDYVNGKDWVWVNKSVFEKAGLADEGVLPPWFPVNVSDRLDGTALEHLLFDNYNLETMDMLNMAYVAMTRAVNELYIFDKRRAKEYQKENNRTFGALLECFAEDWHDKDYSVISSESDRNVILEFGDQPPCKIERANKSKDNIIEIVVNDYHSLPAPDNLRCREESLPQYVDSEEFDIDEDRNPRSMGNICHAIMENVFTVKDLDIEIERAFLLGRLSRNSDYGEELKLHIDKALNKGKYAGLVRKWFSGSPCRIINERSLLKKGELLRRPDRIMIWPDGSVDVIDYKFGKIDTTGKYNRQVRRYAKYLMDTGKYRKVSGWLWYIMEDEIELVTD